MQRNSKKHKNNNGKQQQHQQETHKKTATTAAKKRFKVLSFMCDFFDTTKEKINSQKKSSDSIDFQGLVNDTSRR